MRAFFQFVGHVVWAMVKGFVFTGIVAAILCFGALFATTPGHHLRWDLSAAFALVIAALAAILGAAVALIYHLSHIEEITRALQRRAANREAQRQPSRTR
jgi:hypothetical protein